MEMDNYYKQTRRMEMEMANYYNLESEFTWAKLSTLLGRTLTSIEVSDDKGTVTLRTSDAVFRMYHYQDCCETVWLEDICGDLEYLIGSPILEATEENSGDQRTEEGDQRWTFYKFGTAKGSVTFRFCGESNGYYSIGVDFEVARPVV